MKRTISDCFNLGRERLYAGEQILDVVCEHNDGEYKDLSNGVTIRGTGDGRYYNAADEIDRYAAVVDWDEEFDEGELVGYVQL
nr:MAG TPA: hypothetical protein [Caudoviricetes sp.]